MAKLVSSSNVFFKKKAYVLFSVKKPKHADKYTVSMDRVLACFFQKQNLNNFCALNF